VERNERKFEVESVTVKPVFRQQQGESGREAERNATEGKRKEEGTFKVLFVSEAGIARAVMAQSLFSTTLKALGLEKRVWSEARASRDYAVGEGPQPSVRKHLNEAFDITLSSEEEAEAKVKVLNMKMEAVDSDLILCMDKFVAEDVMKEASLYELTQPEANLTPKIKLLGEWLSQDSSLEKEIDDPLYGNYGGEDEERAVAESGEKILLCCESLCESINTALQTCLSESNGELDIEKMRKILLSNCNDSDLGWLLPPMLQGK
jgi:protein-tyrosine-phosphatase